MSLKPIKHEARLDDMSTMLDVHAFLKAKPCFWTATHELTKREKKGIVFVITDVYFDLGPTYPPTIYQIWGMGISFAKLSEPFEPFDH